MKNTGWNILAGLALLSMVGLSGVVLTIYSNPHSTLNPFPPPTLPAIVVIPSSTMTQIVLPATWTPIPETPTEIKSTVTRVPSATTFILLTDTYTPSPSTTPTVEVITPSETPTNYAYFCEITITKPLDGGLVEYGSNFDGQWRITNGGTETWLQTQVEARYITGTKLQTKKDFIALPRDVEPGSSITLSLDMTAPSDVGTYYSTWGLMTADRVICRWTFAIRVPKPPPSATPTD